MYVTGILFQDNNEKTKGSGMTCEVLMCHEWKSFQMLHSFVISPFD